MCVCVCARLCVCARARAQVVRSVSQSSRRSQGECSQPCNLGLNADPETDPVCVEFSMLISNWHAQVWRVVQLRRTGRLRCSHTGLPHILSPQARKGLMWWQFFTDHYVMYVRVSLHHAVHAPYRTCTIHTTPPRLTFYSFRVRIRPVLARSCVPMHCTSSFQLRNEKATPKKCTVMILFKSLC